jgi:hypothetical protein
MYRYIDVYGMFIGTLCPSLAPIVCLGLALALSPPASLPRCLPFVTHPCLPVPLCIFLPPTLLPSPCLHSLPLLPPTFPSSPPSPTLPFLPLSSPPSLPPPLIPLPSPLSSPPPFPLLSSPPSPPPLSSTPSPPPLPPFRQAATAMRARTALLLAASVGTLVFLGHVRETCGRLSGRVLSAKTCGELGKGVYGLDERERVQPESLLATNSVAHELRGDGPVRRAGRPRHIWETQGGRFADLRADLRSLRKATLMVPPPLPLSLPHPKQGLWAGTSRGL